jgi:hypothetical protein
MTPADEAPEIRLADLLRDAADWTPAECRQVAGVFHWLMAYGEVLRLVTMREAAEQLLALAQTKEEPTPL